MQPRRIVFVSDLRSDTLQGARCIHVAAKNCVCVRSTERHAARSSLYTCTRADLCLCQIYGATRCKELVVYMQPRRFVFVSDLRSDTLQGARWKHLAAQNCVCVRSTERCAARSSMYTCSRADLCLCQIYRATRCKELGGNIQPRRIVFVSDLRSGTLQGARCIHEAAQNCVCVRSTERHAARSSVYTCTRAELCLCQLYGATRCKERGINMQPRRIVFVSALRSDTLQGARCIYVAAQICVCVSSTERDAAMSAVETSSRAELCLCQLYGATRCKERGVYMKPRRFVFVSALRSDTGREEKKLELEDLNPNQPRTKGKARLVLSARYPRATARYRGSVCCLGSRERYLKLYYLDLTIRWLVCLETRSKPKMLSQTIFRIIQTNIVEHDRVQCIKLLRAKLQFKPITFVFFFIDQIERALAVSSAANFVAIQLVV